MHLSEEILWPKFKTLNEIRNLPLQEQIRKYNIYLEQLNYARFQNWYNSQPKGDDERVIVSDGFLQQEDLNYILQEDGSYIIIT